MAWTVRTFLAILLAGMEGVSSCKIDGLSVASDGTIYATRNGWYVGFKPEEIIQQKTAFPSLLKDNGFDTIDAFAVEPGNGNVWFAKGSDTICVKDGNVLCQAKTAFPKEVVDAGFSSVDAFTIGSDGSVILAKGGYYIAMKDDAIVTPKTAIPAILTQNGFTSIDSMAVHPTSGEFLFTLGSHYIILDFSTEAGMVVKGKTCLPAFMTTGGFNSVDGASFDGDGNIWVAKGGYYMGIKPGAVVTPKTAFPKAVVDEGFDTIDAMHIDIVTDIVYFAKGGDYIAVDTDGAIKTPKTPFPQAAKDQGFNSIQGMSVTPDGHLCVAKDGFYMCLDVSKDNATVETPRTAFPAAMTQAGFSAIEGLFIDGTGVVTVVQDGYYMQMLDTTIVTAKTALPSTLTDEMCGSDECVGGLKLGDQGAPTKALSAASTYKGGTVPPPIVAAPGFTSPTPAPTSSAGLASDAKGLIPSVFPVSLLSLGVLLSM